MNVELKLASTSSSAPEHDRAERQTCDGEITFDEHLMHTLDASPMEASAPLEGDWAMSLEWLGVTSGDPEPSMGSEPTPGTLETSAQALDLAFSSSPPILVVPPMVVIASDAAAAPPTTLANLDSDANAPSHAGPPNLSIARPSATAQPLSSPILSIAQPPARSDSLIANGSLSRSLLANESPSPPSSSTTAPLSSDVVLSDNHAAAAADTSTSSTDTSTSSADTSTSSADTSTSSADTSTSSDSPLSDDRASSKSATTDPSPSLEVWTSDLPPATADAADDSATASLSATGSPHHGLSATRVDVPLPQGPDPLHTRPSPDTLERATSTTETTTETTTEATTLIDVEIADLGTLQLEMDSSNDRVRLVIRAETPEVAALIHTRKSELIEAVAHLTSDREFELDVQTGSRQSRPDPGSHHPQASSNGSTAATPVGAASRLSRPRPQEGSTLVNVIA